MTTTSTNNNNNISVVAEDNDNEQCFDFAKHYDKFIASNSSLITKAASRKDLFSKLIDNGTWKLWEDEYEKHDNVIAATFFNNKSFGRLHKSYSMQKLNFEEFFKMLQANEGVIYYDNISIISNDGYRDFTNPSSASGHIICSLKLPHNDENLILLFINMTRNGFFVDAFYESKHITKTHESSSTRTETQKFLDSFESNGCSAQVKQQKKNKASLYSIINQGNGFTLMDMSFKVKDNLLKENFDKYKAVNYPNVNHEKLIKFCAEENVLNLNGKLMLLHGSPGTGKTTYIRHLISEHINPETKVVLMSTNAMSRISSPEFILFAMSHLKNSILLVEEAEKLIVSREETKGESPISDLLNITDGILGDALNIRVIATFNTNSTKIDKALKREGRLFHIQDFPLHNQTQACKFLYANSEHYRKYGQHDVWGHKSKLWEELFKEQKAKEGSVCFDDDLLGKQISLSDLYSIVNRMENKE